MAKAEYGAALAAVRNAVKKREGNFTAGDIADDIWYDDSLADVDESRLPSIASTRLQVMSTRGEVEVVGVMRVCSAGYGKVGVRRNIYRRS